MEVVRARINNSGDEGENARCTTVQLTKINKDSIDRVYERMFEYGFSPYNSADERESDDEYELVIKPGEEVIYTYPQVVIRPLPEPERCALRRFSNQPMDGECRFPVTVTEHLIRIRKLGPFRKIHDFCRAVSNKLAMMNDLPL